MKSTVIHSLILAFSMLVIPLFSLSVKSQSDILQTNADFNDIIYEINEKSDDTNFENFRVLKDGKVISVNAKDYVFGVVAAEMPALYHEEAIKAQAVAAYTFACYKKASATNSEYDISANPDTAQCFITHEEAVQKWGEKAAEYTEKIENCISAVQGQILTFDGNPIFAAYHAISSGTTNSCLNVWGKDLPYLKEVDSSGDKLAAEYLSKVTLTAEETAEKLKEFADDSLEPKDYFGESNTATGGYVKEIMFCGKNVSGSKIAKALGLRSSAFAVEYSDGNFIFTVKGYGHGVGMSQNGANYMANQGSDFKEILLHYYEGAKLQKS